MKYFYCRISAELEYTENVTLKVRIWNHIQLEFATRKNGSQTLVLIIKSTRCTNFSNLFLE
jgi:hypothetical protein